MGNPSCARPGGVRVGWLGEGLTLLAALAMVVLGQVTWASPSASPLSQTVPPRPTGRGGSAPQPAEPDGGAGQSASAATVAPALEVAATAVATAPAGLLPGEATGPSEPPAIGGPAEPAAAGTPRTNRAAPEWSLTVAPVRVGMSSATDKRAAPAPVTRRAGIAALGCLVWPGVGLVLVVTGGLLVLTRRRP